MRMKFKSLAWCTGVCLLASPAFAQIYPAPPSSPGTASRNQQGAAMQPSGRTQQFFHAKNLVGQEARDAQGNKLGEIKDVIFNPQKGEVFAAIDVGRDRHALVPWQALKVTSTGDRGKDQITLNISKETLQSAPTLTSDQWQKLNDPSFSQRLYSHYKLQPPTAMGGTGEDTMGGTSSGAGTVRPKPSPAPIEPKR